MNVFFIYKRFLHDKRQLVTSFQRKWEVKLWAKMSKVVALLPNEFTNNESIECNGTTCIYLPHEYSSLSSSQSMVPSHF